MRPAGCHSDCFSDTIRGTTTYLRDAAAGQPLQPLCHTMGGCRYQSKVDGFPRAWANMPSTSVQRLHGQMNLDNGRVRSEESQSLRAKLQSNWVLMSIIGRPLAEVVSTLVVENRW